MKKIFYLLVCLIISLNLSAQTARTTTVKGMIVDASDNSPLVGALVFLDSTKYSTTDIKGNFTIANVPINDFTAKITYLGYRMISQNLKTSGVVVNMGIIKMMADTELIEKIVVEGNAIVAIQKGDTTQYNAAAFKVNPDAYTGDLISKMPGMEVTESGVKAQGESISRVYVDGKLMFGDDPMAAINNLPADNVESIQMFDELSDEAKFSGYDDGKLNRSLNIITKYKIKTAANGRVEVGYGKELDKNVDDKYQDRYTANVQANIFSLKRTVMVSATMNNTNSATGRGGYGRGGGMGGLNNISSAQFAYNQEWENKLKFNVNYMYNGTDSETSKRTIQNYFPTAQFDSRIYADTSVNNNTSYRHNAGMRIEYTLNRNNKFMFMPRVSFSDGDSHSLNSMSNTTILKTGEPLFNRTQTSNTGATNNYNVGGTLMWSRNLGKAGRSLSLRASATFRENDDNNLQLDTLAASTRPMDITTVSSGWGRNLGARITYSEPLSVSSLISANYEIKYENSKSDRIAFDNNINKIDSVLSNIYTRNYTTNRGGLSYSFSKGNYRLNAGVDYETSKLNKDQELPVLPVSIRPYTFDNLMPQLNFRYNIGRTKNIRVSYNTSADLPSIEQLQNVINNSNPLQLSAGNPNLKESYSHNLQVGYNTSNIEKSTNLGFNVRASLTDNSVSTKTRFFTEDVILSQYNDFHAQKGSQLRTPVNINGKYTLEADVNYGFPIKVVKSRINMGLSYAFQRTPSYDNEILNYSNANNANFRIALESNISTNVDFTISSRTGYKFATNTTKENTNYFSEAVTGRVNIIFLGGFVLSSDITYNYNKSSSSTGYTDRYAVWNAGLGHKFFNKNQGEFKITMYDILKQNTNLNHTINDNYIADTWTNTIGRYVMATFSYRFNSLNSVAAKNNGNRGGFDENSPRPMRVRGEGGGGFGGHGEGGARGGSMMTPLF